VEPKKVKTMWLLFIAGASILVLAYTATKQHALTLPVTLPVDGPGGSGETATQQETQSGIQTASTVATDAASGNIPGAVAAGVSGLITQLTQHSARLADAKAENVAMQPAVEAFDADLQAIAAAYVQGQITAAQAAQAIATLDANLYANLHSLVGKPGTAWNVPQQTMDQDLGATCNTACTVSCCVYNNDLHSPLVAAYQYLLYYNGMGLNVNNVNSNARPYLNSNWGGQLYADGFVLGVPEIYPPDDPAYGDFSRPKYSVNFVPTSAGSSSALASFI
jgi:hypothetical protein